MELLKYNEINEEQFKDYITEWEGTEEKIVPSVADNKNLIFQDLVNKWASLEDKKTVPSHLVPATLYFMVEKEKIIGAIDFRHSLNDNLLKFGGHIGYGIRPSERKKGYGIIMLNLLLKKLKTIDVTKVLITCFEDNIGSARIIESCGGQLENLVSENGSGKKRYWIDLSV